MFSKKLYKIGIYFLCFFVFGSGNILECSNQDVSSVFFVTWPGLKIDAQKVSNFVKNLPTPQRAVNALKFEGESVASAIVSELPAEAVFEEIWASRGVIARFPSPRKISDLRKSFSNLEWENLEGFTLSPIDSEEAPQADLQIQAPHFWNLAMCGSTQLKEERNLTGKGVLVGVLGVDVPYMHPCLSGKVKFYKEIYPPHQEPRKGRETYDLRLMHPLGILAGSHPELEISVAPDTRLALATIAKENLNAENFLVAMQWLLLPKAPESPRAILLALDFSGKVPKAAREMLQSFKTAGILPIVPAGNSPHHITGMAALPECTTVGALDQWGSLALFSGNGPAQCDGISITKPDCMEPGVGIYGPGANPKWYRFGSGTLQAAAHFAGVWAQIRQARPADENQVILDALATTTKDIGTPGPDNATGYGLFDPAAAIYTIENPPPPPEDEWP